MNEQEKKSIKAAFEITKGIQQVLTLSEDDVERYLDPQELLDGLEDGFRGLEIGEVQAPQRPQLSVAERGFSLAMLGVRPRIHLQFT
jgi:alanine dehydrogenase